MMKEQLQSQNAVKGNENTTRWVFIPCPKENVLRKEETYLLIKLSDNATAIISSKFKRTKESDDCIFLSIPEDYNVKVRFTKKNPKTNRYEVSNEKQVDAWYVRKCIVGDKGNDLPF